MSYFDELDAWLTAVLIVTEDDEDEEQWFLRVKKQIKDKVLESYRNGQKSGKTGDKPSGKNGKPEEDREKPRSFWQARKAKRS